MSIIEKAIDKLEAEGEPARRTPTSAPDGERAATRSTIEAAVEVAPLAREGRGEPLQVAAAASDRSAEAVPEVAGPPLAGTPPIQPAAAEKTETELSGPSGPLPIAALGLEGIISPHSERSRTAEEYRMIKRPLLQRAFAGEPPPGAHQNVIMVTSSVAGEGKTFTSLNLAISIAMEMDRTVLLVDADLARPGLSKLLRVQDLPGLTDRLLDPAVDLKGMLRRTDVPKLTLLPAGSRHKRSTELLASKAMKDLLDELAQRYADRVIVFDSPPLLATSEASVLAEHMGQICVVVESGRTPQYLVKEAIGLLQYKERVSLVLNKAQRDLLLGQGSYYYGYRYRDSRGYGYAYGKEGADA